MPIDELVNMCANAKDFGKFMGLYFSFRTKYYKKHKYDPKNNEEKYEYERKFMDTFKRYSAMYDNKKINIHQDYVAIGD